MDQMQVRDHQTRSFLYRILHGRISHVFQLSNQVYVSVIYHVNLPVQSATHDLTRSRMHDCNVVSMGILL